MAKPNPNFIETKKEPGKLSPLQQHYDKILSVYPTEICPQISSNNPSSSIENLVPPPKSQDTKIVTKLGNNPKHVTKNVTKLGNTPKNVTKLGNTPKNVTKNVTKSENVTKNVTKLGNTPKNVTKSENVTKSDKSSKDYSYEGRSLYLESTYKRGKSLKTNLIPKPGSVYCGYCGKISVARQLYRHWKNNHDPKMNHFALKKNEEPVQPYKKNWKID